MLCHSSQITITGCFLLLGLSIAIGLAFFVVAVVVSAVIIALRTMLALVLVLSLVLLVCLGLRLAGGIPEFLFLVFLGLGEVLLLQEDLTDVVTLESFFSYFFVVRDKVFIQFVAKILHIFKNDGAGLVIDTRKETFKALSALELHVYLIGEEFLYWWNTHIFFN